MLMKSVSLRDVCGNLKTVVKPVDPATLSSLTDLKALFSLQSSAVILKEGKIIAEDVDVSSLFKDNSEEGNEQLALELLDCPPPCDDYEAEGAHLSLDELQRNEVEQYLVESKVAFLAGEVSEKQMNGLQSLEDAYLGLPKPASSASDSSSMTNNDIRNPRNPPHPPAAPNAPNAAAPNNNHQHHHHHWLSLGLLMRVAVSMFLMLQRPSRTRILSVSLLVTAHLVEVSGLRATLLGLLKSVIAGRFERSQVLDLALNVEAWVQSGCAVPQAAPLTAATEGGAIDSFNPFVEVLYTMQAFFFSLAPR